MRERGSASLLAVTVIALVMVLGLGALGVTRMVGAKMQAQTAADAAALAAAAATFAGPDPHREAGRFAAANGARLVSCHCRPDRRPVPRRVSVQVEVRLAVPVLGEVAVPARAEAEYRPPRVEFVRP